MDGGIGSPGDVDLREWTERSLAGDAHFVAAFDDFLDLAFHCEPGLERVLELALRRGVADTLARQHDAAAGRKDHRLDTVADRHLDVALGVLEFREVDLGFALPADVDEGHLLTERDDSAFDDLAALESTRLERSLEHGCEIFVVLAHCVPAWMRTHSARSAITGSILVARRAGNHDANSATSSSIAATAR